MFRRVRTVAAALVLGLTGSLMATAPGAGADPEDPSDQTGGLISRVVTTPLGDVTAYWTKQRRASAVPMDAVVRGGADPTASRAAGRRGSDAVAANAKVPVPRSMGKLFFSDTDADYVCSAAVVKAKGRDQVLTAGHCVHTGPSASGSPLPILGGLFFTPHFFENFYFVPRYRDGKQPFGGWVGRQVHVSTAWTEDEDFRHDQAILEMAPSEGGERIGDVVGMNRIAIGLGRKQAGVRVWGWPAERPYDGETAWRCDGRTRPISGGDAVLPCSLNGGASGGPWLVDRTVETKRGKAKRPVIWAVTSRRFLGSPRLIAAPLPPEVRALRKAAAR